MTEHLYFDKEESWAKLGEKIKREHAMFEQRLQGASVLICACEEGGVGLPVWKKRPNLCYGA